MTLLQANAESGTNGAAVTTSNTNFSTVTVGASNTLTFSTTQAQQGTQSFKGVLSATAADLCLVQYQSGPASAAAARMYVYLTSLPTTAQIMSIRGTSGVMARWQFDASGKLQLTNSAGTSLYLAASAAPLNQWLRLELWAQAGTGTSDGQITGAWYLGDSTTAQGSFTSTTTNAGTVQANFLQAGKINAVSSFTGTFYLDNVGFQDGATGMLGPYVPPNIPPTCSAGANQANVEPWTTVALTGTDADSDGTVVTRAWTQTAGTSAALSGAATANASFTAPGTLAGDLLTFQYAVTDNSGATGTSTTTVGVLAATERAVIAGAEVPMQIREN